jgi:cytochrome c oxidase assembly factor CtaG
VQHLLLIYPVPLLLLTGMPGWLLRPGLTHAWVAPRIVPLTPLEDQQLGGILMHVAGMGVLFIALVVVFRQWYQTENVSHTHDSLLHLR